MSKDAAAFKDLPLPETTDVTQSSPDIFGTNLNAPIRKLDADEYTANDLDGVTDSATGSGNLNFLMMQAGQTNEAIHNLNPFNIAGGDNLHFNAFGGGNNFDALPATDNGFDTAMDRPFDGESGFSGLGDLGQTGQTNNSAGSLSASNLAASTSAQNPFSDVRSFAASSSSDTTTSAPPIPPTNGSNGADGEIGPSGSDGSDGNNGTNGNDGLSGLDGLNGLDGLDGISQILNFGPVGLSLDLVLDNLTNIKIDGILGDTVTNIIDETLNLSPVLDPVESLVGNLLSSTSLDILLNPFQPDNSPNDYDLHVGTNLDLLGIQIPDIGIDVPLDIVEALTGDLDISLDLTNDLLGAVPVVGDLVDGLLGNGGNGDTDLALGGLGGLLDADVTNGIVETVLNPVENLIGDLDIGGSIGLDLLGLDSGQSGPDTDISIPLDIGLIDNPVLSDTLNINLDPLENIVGDIDLDLGVAGNLLGDVAAPLFDGIAGGNGENDLLNQLGDSVSGLVGDALPFGDSADTDLSLDTGIGPIDNALDLALNPVEDLVGDIDIGADIGLGLLGTADNSGTDSDLTIPIDIGFIDSPLVSEGLDIDLDFVESIVGDVDIDLGVATNLLGDAANPLFDSENGGSGTDNLLSFVDDGASDLLAPIAPDLSGIVEPAADSLLADTNSLLDIVIDTATELLDAAAPLTSALDLDALSGGTDPLESVTAWTETILPDAGSLLGGGLLSDPTSIIPDPIGGLGDIALPVPVIIPTAPIIGSGGLLGGLGGGGHGGGLFG